MRDCLVHNQSSDSAAVISCSAGYDGGLKQSFVLEVYDRRKEQLMKNLTQDDDPRFRLESLSPNTPYAFVVYSYNMKGKSARISVNYQIPPVLPQDSTDPSATAVAAPAATPVPAQLPSSSTTSSTPASPAGDSASDSLNAANESRSDDGASLPSSSSAGEAAVSSSLSSLLMRVALLPVLGIVSGLILTFILLGVIFSVLHSIRKQERGSSKPSASSSASDQSGRCSLGPVIPGGTSPSASCDSSAAFHHLHDQQ